MRLLRFLWLVLFLIIGNMVIAGTCSCPVCRIEFPVIDWKKESNSDSVTLDGQTVGERPPPLPECPLCGGVFHNLSIAEAEQKKLEAAIWSKEYQQSRTGNSWHRHALLKEKLGRPAIELAQTWLEAAWASQGEQKRDAMTRAVRYFENHLIAEEGRENSEELLLKLADLYRQLGDFAKAASIVEKIKDPALSRKVRLEKSLIDEKTTASTAVPNGNSLHKAIRENNLSLIRKLAGQKQLHQEKNSQGLTPLQLAVEYNQPKAVASIISGAIDPASPDALSSLHYAAKNGMVNICRLLIEAGVKHDQRDAAGNNLLHLACAGDSVDRIELAKFLIEKGININQRNFADLTPFHVAATCGNHQLLELLTKNGARVNARLPDGRTALFICRNDLIKHLFDLGINYQAFDNQGQTAFVQALLVGSHQRVAEFKKTGRFGLALSENDHIQKFWHAIKENNLTKLKKMIDENEKIVDVRVLSFGESPLHLASLQDNHEMVQILLEKHANPNPGNDFNRTPMHYAAMKGNLRIVKLLKEAGANIHAVDARGSTPLHEAASSGAIEVYNYLANSGAADSNLNNSGKSPKDLLEENN